jgi:hypothetical protein
MLFFLRFGFELPCTANNRAARGDLGPRQRVSSVEKHSSAATRMRAQRGAEHRNRACRNCKRKGIARKKDRDGSGSSARCEPHRARSIS